MSGATNLEVRTIGVDGSRQRILTSHPPAGDLPTWVEHGRAISFWGSDEGLWLMPSSGGSARRVARVSDYSTLSPSGTKVAVVAGRLTITDSNGRTLRRYPLKLRGPDGFNSPEQTAWAPNERRVAFQVLGETDTGDEPGRLLVVDLASGRIHTIRVRGTIDSDPPAWSPDSRKLAFLAGPISVGNDDLYVSAADGSSRARVARDVSLDQANPVVWSPDGRRLAFVRTTSDGAGPHPGTIFVVSAQGGSERRIAGARAIAALAWSPDGTRLAFSAAGGLFVVRIGGGTERVTLRGARSSVSWAPSNRILFGDAKSIYSVDGNGHTLRALGTQLNDGWPVWSPDGRTIAFVRGRDARGLDVAADVWTMTARGRNVRQAGAGYEPAWSPDSRRLAYVRTIDGKPEIVVQPLAGGTARVVTHGTSPSWSPDGKLIAFVSGSTQVRVVSPNGTHERVLLEGTSFEDVNGVAWEHYIAPIVWAPRGDELAVAAALLEQDGTDDGDLVRVATLPSGASRTLPLFANSGLDWSPDGKTLVGVSEAGLATIPVHGTASQTIVPSDWPLILSNPAWSSDGRLIAYNSCRRQVCEIRVASADGSTQHRVVRLSAPQMSFDFGTDFTSGWQPR